MCITETWANDSISSAELSLNGMYTVYRKDRQCCRGGGVCILIKQGIKCLEVVSAPSSSEIVAVDIFDAAFQRIRLMCVYFSPTGATAELVGRMRTLCHDLKHLMANRSPVIITGDFNLPGIDWRHYSAGGPSEGKEDIFLSFCLMHGLSQLVSTCTRPASGSLLDLLLTDEEDIVNMVTVEPAPIKSDHLGVYFKVVFSTLANASAARLNYNRTNYDSIGRLLEDVSWREFFQNAPSVDCQYAQLCGLLGDLLTECTPLADPAQPPFLDAVERRVKFRLENCPLEKEKLRLARQLARVAHRKRFLTETNLRIGSAKDFFRYANKRLNVKAGIAPLVKDNTVLLTDAEKADVLRTCFKEVFISSADPRLVPLPSGETSFNDIEFSTLGVFKELCGIKQRSSLTPDGLPPIVFRRLADVLAEPLSIIFTRSFEEGNVPLAFNRSIVTPVYKKGSRACPENYRPISQCVIPCLVMERIVVKAVSSFLAKQGLLDPHQHGFVQGRSTATQLLEVNHDWVLARNRRLSIHCVYFDFSRAFDRVDHGLLLQKMASLGIGPRVISWCQAYLRNRSFIVKVGASVSEPASCTSGVPQGSCVGPLMYSLFVLDLGLSLRKLDVKYKLYADDLKVYTTVRNEQDMRALQAAIDCVRDWCVANRMLVAAHKCAVMKTKPDDAVYLFDGCPLTEVDSYRDLGVVFDNSMKFGTHIAEMAKAAARLCNLILRTFSIQNPSVYLKLYNALVVPKWTYCSSIWASLKQKDTLLLQRIQNKFIKRVALRCKVPRETIILPSVEEYQRKVDLRVLKRLISNGQVSHYFSVQKNNLRSGGGIYPPEVAVVDIVHDAFAWRVARWTRECDDFRNIVLPLFK